MADVAKVKSEENQDKENIDESGDSEVEETVKDKKNNVDKSKKKNAAPAPAAKIKPPAKKRVKAEQAEESKKEKDGKKKKIAVKDKEEDDEEEEEEEEDGEDEDDAEEGDDEGSEGEENGVPEKVPLLDQPLEISGSRERKQVERFIPKEDLKSDADKKVEIPNGKGKPLGEIPRIQFQINKLKVDNLKSLHKVLFSRVGQAHTIKKNIGQFKGFEFEKDSADQKKKLSVLTKLKNADLKTLCTILDLQKSGKHAELADRILDFLIKPVDSGKEPPDPRPKRKGISSKSYKEPKADGDDEQSKKGKSKQHLPSKKKNKASSEDDEQDEDSDEKKTEDEEENEPVGSEKDKPKKGPTKRPPAKKTASNSASGAKKRTAPTGTGGGGGNKKGKEKSDSETEHNSEAEDSEKEVPAKKSKSPPTDDEIKSYVKSVLEGANLEEITMKTVCKKVYEHYPDFDLGYKKEFIKNTVKSLIAS
ncbi:protein DEK-like isoform X2 [Lycorma delicatula]|uniref:protein DEK-like isoform X2 n=1 Tax=Lycorma delicatula TaxID=130591 RepID=UPI003F50E429